MLTILKHRQSPYLKSTLGLIKNLNQGDSDFIPYDLVNFKYRAKEVTVSQKNYHDFLCKVYEMKLYAVYCIKT